MNLTLEALMESARRASSNLRQREIERLGGVAHQGGLWDFRPWMFLGVRYYFRYALHGATRARRARRRIALGAAADVVGAARLRSNKYPYAARVPIEITEAASLSTTVADYSAAAQLTVPLIMELAYRGGARYALPVSGMQVLVTLAARKASAQSASLRPFGYHSIAVIAVDQLANLENERHQLRASFSTLYRRSVAASGYLAGRYDAASRNLAPADGESVIPHDELLPVASILEGLGAIDRPALLDSPLGQIGPRQQKAYLRGLSVTLADAIVVWRSATNRDRPRVDDQLLAGEVPLPDKGNVWLLTASQTEALFRELDALQLPGGRLVVSNVRAREYGSTISMEVNDQSIVVSEDRSSVPIVAANILLAAPAGATLWALSECLPGSSDVPLWAAGAASIPAARWWHTVARTRPTAEEPQLGIGVAVAAAQAGLLATFVRLSGHVHPAGVSPWSQALLAPAAMLGACWTRVGMVTKAATFAALALVVGVTERSIPRGNRRPMGFQLSGSVLSFGVGLAFDQARMGALKGYGSQVQSELAYVRDAMFWAGRADELKLCLAACRQALDASRHLPDSARLNVESRLALLSDALQLSLEAALSRIGGDRWIEGDVLVELRARVARHEGVWSE